MRDATLEAVARQFRPEFINRIHEQIVFHPLSEVDVRRVLRPLLGQICQNLEQQYGVSLLVDPNVEILLARIGHSLLYGIRELRRVVEIVRSSPPEPARPRWQVDQGLALAVGG